MNQKKVRELKTMAFMTYKPEWFKRFGMTFKNYFKQVKREYARGNYAKK